jgi:hypothetical protein
MHIIFVLLYSEIQRIRCLQNTVSATRVRGKAPPRVPHVFEVRTTYDENINPILSDNHTALLQKAESKVAPTLTYALWYKGIRWRGVIAPPI